jgi:N-acetylglucosaminyldiphosphoundecaprenol N-acetyl-beta-D-mannosaminyltransferase
MFPLIETPVLGVRVSATNSEQFLACVSRNIVRNVHTLVVGHNLHSTYIYKTNFGFRDFYESADIILCDGFPVFLDAKKKAPNESIQRLGSTDWIPKLIERSDGLKVLVIGASNDSNERFCSELTALNPKIIVHGMSGMPWAPDLPSKAKFLAQSLSPDLVLVGLGMPRQEEFVVQAELRKLATVVACIGGAIDQIAGVQRNSPRWLGMLGLEWLWRLSHNPKRLSYRYLIEPILLLRVLLHEFLSGSKNG